MIEQKPQEPKTIYMDQIMIQKGMTADPHIDDQHFLGLAQIPLHKLAQNWAALGMHQVYLILTQKYDYA